MKLEPARSIERPGLLRDEFRADRARFRLRRGECRGRPGGVPLHPQGLRDLSTVFSAPLGGYDIPLPFFSDANAELWHAAIGYEVESQHGQDVRLATYDVRTREAGRRIGISAYDLSS